MKVSGHKGKFQVGYYSGSFVALIFICIKVSDVVPQSKVRFRAVFHLATNALLYAVLVLLKNCSEK